MLTACAVIGTLALTTAALFATGVVPANHADAAPAAIRSDDLGIGPKVVSLEGALDPADKVPVAEEAQKPDTMTTVQERAKAPLPKPKPKPKPASRPTAPAAGASAPSRATDTTGWLSAKASWYGPGFYGRNTASGAVLTTDMMNVAHRTLPFGTRIQFEYKGRTATAVVNDRGPFVGGRVFDLGPGTAGALGFSGVGTVRYRILGR